MESFTTKPAADLFGTEFLFIEQPDGSKVKTTIMEAQEAVVKTYVCSLSQTGTEAPIPITFVNTIGEVSWERLDEKNYRLISPGSFPSSRTIFNPGVDPSGNYITRVDEDTMNLYVEGGDDSLSDYKFEVKVYRYIITNSPTNFTASTIDYQQIDLNWDAVDSADNYLLERSMDQENWDQAYLGSSTSFSDIELVADNQYFYRLQALTAGERGSRYVYADATTDIEP